MLGQFPVMKLGTANDSIHALTTDPLNTLLIAGDTTGWVSVSNPCYHVSLSVHDQATQ